MAELMANADVALSTFLGSSSEASGGGDNGQAKAPESHDTKGGSETNTEQKAVSDGAETPDSTTAEADALASVHAKEQAELTDEYKPFETMLRSKKWDPKAKDFAPTVLKSLSELESAYGKSNTEKSLLNTRQTEFQRRLSGDAKSINDFRKANGLPEIPVGKTFSEQAQERAEYFSHINNVLTGQNEETSRAWLNKQLVEGLQDLRIKAGVEAMQQNKTNDQHQQEFRGKANSVFTEHIARTPADEAVFNQYVLPLAGPNGLLGSYGLDVAHVAQSPEHVQAWAKIGRALQLAENYEKAVADGIKSGVDAEMAHKRKAGNAGGIGSQGKQSNAAGANDDFYRELARR